MSRRFRPGDKATARHLKMAHGIRSSSKESTRTGIITTSVCHPEMISMRQNMATHHDEEGLLTKRPSLKSMTRPPQLAASSRSSDRASHFAIANFAILLRCAYAGRDKQFFGTFICHSPLCFRFTGRVLVQ